MEFRLLTEPHLAARDARTSGYDELLRFTRCAEDAGYDAVFRTDHYPVGASYHSGDAWISLAALARDTRRIRLGIMGSTITFRTAGQLAIMVGQVDELAGNGRLELGLSMGWSEREHRAYGIALPDVPTRLARYEEQLAVLRGVGATPVGTAYRFTGDRESVELSGTGAAVPIIVGGGGIGASGKVDLAARYADEFNLPYCSVAHVKTEFDKVRSRCAAIMRDKPLRCSVSLPLCCGSTASDVRRRTAVTRRTEEELAEIGVRGSAQQCIDTLAGYVAAGVDRIYLQVLDVTDTDQIEYFATSVLGSFGANRQSNYSRRGIGDNGIDQSGGDDDQVCFPDNIGRRRTPRQR
ncbi:LLM class flavin-dependent oxidoreductase [Nocardia sp. Marseille-Q1738]